MVVCKVNKISRQILEVVSNKRLKKLLKTILIAPVDKAMDKLDKSHDNKAFKKSIYSFIDDMLCPELLTEFFLTVLMSGYSSTTMTLLKKMVDSPDDIKPLVEKLVSAIEDNAEEIGKIIKKVTIVTSSIIDELSEDDDEDDDDSEKDDSDSKKDICDSEEDISDSEKNTCNSESNNENSRDKEFVDSLTKLLEILDSHIFCFDDNDSESNEEVATEVCEAPNEEVATDVCEAPNEEVTTEICEVPNEEVATEVCEPTCVESVTEITEEPIENTNNIPEETTK